MSKLMAPIGLVLASMALVVASLVSLAGAAGAPLSARPVQTAEKGEAVDRQAFGPFTCPEALKVRKALESEGYQTQCKMGPGGVFVEAWKAASPG